MINTHRRFRFSSLAAMTLAVAIAGTSAACGGNGGPSYDFGPYRTQRADADYDTRPSRARGILAESLRLGEQITFASEIDPTLTVGRGGGPIADHHGVSNLISAAQQKAVEPFPVNGAFGAIAADRPYAADGNPESMLSISLLEFPDEQTAAAAAAAMARADFEANPDNAPVTLDAYPAALSHWRPGVPTLGSWIVSKSVVIRVFARLHEPDLGKLVDLVSTTYRKQLENLEPFTPTPAAELPTARLDRDGLLTRLVKTGDYTPDWKKFAVYGTHSYALLRDNPATYAQDLGSRGVSSIAVSYNKFLYRVRDAATAASLAEFLDQPGGSSEYVAMRGVDGMSDIRCSEARKPSPSVDARRFRCAVPREDGVAVVYSNQESDVRQLAAAQYEVMGDHR